MYFPFKEMLFFNNVSSLHIIIFLKKINTSLSEYMIYLVEEIIFDLHVCIIYLSKINFWSNELKDVHDLWSLTYHKKKVNLHFLSSLLFNMLTNFILFYWDYLNYMSKMNSKRLNTDALVWYAKFSRTLGLQLYILFD